MKKEYRIKKNQEIQSVLSLKQSIVGKHFIIYKKESHQEHFRYALSVSKKFGHAVERNKMKRQLRDILDNLNISNKYDLFVITRLSAKDISFESKKSEIITLLTKINVLENVL